MKLILFATLCVSANGFTQSEDRRRQLSAGDDDDGFEPHPARYGDVHNSAVTRKELLEAGAASAKVYDYSCCPSGTYSNETDGWQCEAVVEVPHNYWFENEMDSSFPSMTRFHFFSAPDNKCGFVFRGTEKPRQFQTNLNGAFVSWWFGGEYIHTGFKYAFDGKYTEPDSDGKKTLLKKGVIGDVSHYLDKYKDSKCKNGVYFVGHSLGGALATVADIWYESTKHKPATSITFGAPKMTQVKSTKKNYNELRVYHKYDLVAAHWGRYEHRGPSKRIECNKRDICECGLVEVFDGGNQGTAERGFENICTDGYPAIKYHSMKNYLKWIRAEAGPPTPAPTPPPTPPKTQYGYPCQHDSDCQTNYCKTSFFLGLAGLCWDQYDA